MPLKAYIEIMPLKAYNLPMDYPIQTSKQLSAHLRSLRKARSLTQAQLGVRVGLDQTRIAKIERDPSLVSVGQLLQILAILGTRMVLRASGEKAHPATRQGDDTSNW
jgi:HTH-type transcriptional regulator/antitoxin HipB